jgi:glycosyltransferase involved in cell wall biosynthesis
MPQISAIIITFNVEAFIERCLVSLTGIADEIIVVDSFSTDSTQEICKKHNVRFITHDFNGYRDQKNYALSLASYQYVLSLDADEALSEELKKSILAIKENWKYDGYLFNRLNNYCGQWIHHCKWYPDKQLRLFDSKKGKWGGFNIHEKVMMEKGSKVRRVKGDLLHWAYSSHEDHIEKIKKYSTIGAAEYYKAGRKAGPFTAVIHFLWSFFRSFILQRGFLDGHNGYLICSITAYSSYLKYIKLRELQKKES